jgi:renalase
MGDRKTCLIVGAGMAGLSAAAVLRDAGWNVLLLDKGRGVGGRMATRRVGDSRFDHGAQFFTVRDARFAQALEEWAARGWVMPWFTAEGHIRYRGSHGMNGLTKKLAAPFEVRTETTVTSLEPSGQGWRALADSGQEFRSDAVILTCPVPQSLALLSFDVPETLRDIAYNPCFALMALLEGQSLVPAPGYVRPDSGPVAFMADNTQKGICQGPSALTIHATPEFSRQWFDSDRDEVTRLLLEAARPWIASPVASTKLHRWKFSQPVQSHPESCVFMAAPAPLAFAGDAFAGPRVEGAWMSGFAAAARIVSNV